MRLKVVSEHKDTATSSDLGMMSIAGLAAARNVPFLSRAVWSKKSNYADSAAARCGLVNLGRECLLADKGAAW